MMPLAAGTRLGPYEVLRLIGAGGMGEVYACRDTRLERTVAVKILPPEFAGDPDRRSRFEREARAVSALNHPNIVSIYDIGEAAGISFQAMEYVSGGSLDRVIARDPVDTPRLVAWSLEIAEALAAAHAAGIVHRDIKPANVLVTEDGRVKVVDFGLARHAPTIAPATSTTISSSGLRNEPSMLCGTPGFIAPEVLDGHAADARSDVFAIGCVMFELATGTPACGGSSPYARMAAALQARVIDPRQVRGDVPPLLAKIIARCLEREPARRYASAIELAADLRRVREQVSARRVPLRLLLRRPAVIAAAVAFLVAVVATAGWYLLQESRERRVREVILPEATRLIRVERSYAGHMYRAFRLLREAEALTPGDPQVRSLLEEATAVVDVTSEPPGADVYVRAYVEDDTLFEHLGRTPLRTRLPIDDVMAKAVLSGYETRQIFDSPMIRTIHLTLTRTPSPHPGMIYLRGGRSELFDRAVQLAPYWVGKYEITNREFAEFMAAGGYQRESLWSGLALPDVQGKFRDRTGRVGPSTWEVGRYPEGQSEHPVSGVSWFEAAAYCRSVGAELPTIFHWYDAAAPGSYTQFAPFGNFHSHGTAPVGHPLRMGANGTYDMAGNVREWTSTVAGANRRYLAGGGWREPSYSFADHAAEDPLNRGGDNGFRCAAYSTPLAREVTDAVALPFRDYRREKPVDDAAYAVIEGLFRHDALPLDAKIESRVTSAELIVERVSYRAAYDDERVPALLYLPRHVKPPYQAVIYFPGAGPWYSGVSEFVPGNVEDSFFLFLVRSGRALLLPMYKGTYERFVPGQGVLTPRVWRETIVHAGLDLKRSLDYLESRSDMTVDKVAYYGLSMGAGVGPLMAAIEPRLRASVLFGGGLYPWRRPAESDTFNFLPRVRVPTLMINGRHDYFFAYDTSQVPMFEWLGTPEKRHRVFDSGHLPSEKAECIRETLDWLDKYLGPVNSR